MNATNIVVRPQQAIKGIRLQIAARVGTFATLKSAGLVEDTASACNLGEVVCPSTSTKNQEGESFRVE